MDNQTGKFRKHLRLTGFDYRENQPYFVTIVTGNRECIFGSIQDGLLKPTRRGLIATECWNDIPTHHSFVELDAFIVMPNHVHGILMFVGEGATKASQLQRPGAAGPIVAATPASPSLCQAKGPTSHSLGAVIGSFKSAVSRKINRLRPGAADHLWQPNYYEHIIRHDRALDSIREYILTNPTRWEKDRENPVGDGSDDFQAFIKSSDVAELKKGDAGVAATGARR